MDGTIAPMPIVTTHRVSNDRQEPQKTASGEGGARKALMSQRVRDRMPKQLLARASAAERHVKHTCGTGLFGSAAAKHVRGSAPIWPFCS